MKRVHKEAIWRYVSEDGTKPHWELDHYLVRCYRCKFAKSIDDKQDSYKCAYNDKYLTKSHGYCSSGERKDEEE